MRTILSAAVVVCWAASAGAATLQSHCIALAQGVPGVQYASLTGEALASDEVRLHFVGHSTYLLETSGGLTVATDYTGYIGGDALPDVVTMNRAHSSHYTDHPDPAIAHVLRGWGEAGGRAEHHLDLEEMLIRNVTTDIRSQFGDRQKDANSIFIFEVAGLCIGHLGHIHHEPTEEHYALIGRLDVVMAPVDGGMTLDTATMIRVLKRARASVVLPMHWFGRGTLEHFLTGMRDEFAVEFVDGSGLTVSLRDLPRTPTIFVLQPGPLR